MTTTHSHPDTLPTDPQVDVTERLRGELRRRAAALPLEAKVRLVTGATAWSTHTEPSLGLREIVMSDGPAGVRGTEPGQRAVSFPAPTALAATWDLDLVDRVAGSMAAEARGAGVDVLLAPVINLQRTPLGGRHFESFSEDPFLVGLVGEVFITGLQRRGVGACAKHFVANECETERTSYTSVIGPETLRAMYLPPFDRAVRRAGSWTVMAAYNAVDDGTERSPATEHHGLLDAILRDEWRYDGLVVSDWAAARSTDAARAGLDLVMPGPDGPWGTALLEQVRAGAVPETALDDKVVNLMVLAARVGKLEGFARAPLGTVEPAAALSREVAARATVVLRRDRSTWPLRLTGADAVRRVALIGENALEPYAQGGGSAKVEAPHEISPVQGLQTALDGTGVELSITRGGRVRELAPPLEIVRTTSGTAHGVRARYLDAQGEPLRDEVQQRTLWLWTTDMPGECDAVELSTSVHLREPGVHRLQLGSIGYHDVWVDDELVRSERRDDGSGSVLDSSVNAPPGIEVEVEVSEGPRDVTVRMLCQVASVGDYGRVVSASLRHLAPEPSIDEQLAQAEQAAAAADVAVVVVGTNGEVESEGWDRTGLALPGRQDELVRRVVAVNPRTIVVVNAGAPVLLPWLDDVGTVLFAWLGGQELGHALADVLLGRVEAQGRLPWTLPAHEDDCPIYPGLPVDGQVHYEGPDDVGHLAWQRRGRVPAAPFGHGLGWADWRYGQPIAVPRPDDGAHVTVSVSHDADRISREVVQVYVRGPQDGLLRLAGFATADVAAGEEREVTVVLEPGAIGTGAGWEVHVGRSLADIRGTVDAPLPR